MNRTLSRAAAFCGALTIAVSGLVAIGAAPTAAATPLDETVTVGSRNPAGASSVNSLTAGSKYVLTVKGLYSYGKVLKQGQAGTADAECANLPPDTNYQRNRFLLLEPQGDLLDLYVNGAAVEWQAASANAFGCASDGDHTYTLVLTPTTDGPVSFNVHDTSNGDDTGALTVRIQEVADQLVDTVTVGSASRGAKGSNISLDPSKSYRFESSGTFTFGTPGTVADTECSGIPGAPLQRNAFGPILTPTDLGDDPLDLYVNGVQQDWVAKHPGATDCDDTNHEYTLAFTPAAAGKVYFKVQDTNYSDNVGALTIKIYLVVSNPPTAASTALPNVSLNEQVQVPANSRSGVNSKIPVTAGQSYMLEAAGSYMYGPGQQADSLCSTATGDPTWMAGRTFTGVTDPDVLTLLVNGQGASWVPTTESPAGSGCNTTDHTYRLVFVPSSSGVVNFRVDDPNVGDNTGALTVKIVRIREIPVGAILVDSTKSTGANTQPLVAGSKYRLNSQGTYSYWKTQAGTNADAECAQQGYSPYFDTTYQPNRFGNGDLLDLYVAGHEVTWKPVDTTKTYCDDGQQHSYEYFYSPTATAQVNLKIYDTQLNYADNAGSLTVQIYLEVS